MKKIILKVIITALVLSTSAFASNLEFNTKSLVGIEGSYNSFTVANDASFSEKVVHGGFGIKIGAQSDNYRLFLSARNKFIPNYDYAYALGAEVQYLMNFSSVINMFVGVNAGYLNLKFDDEASLTRELSSKYFGGDIGFNLHMSEVSDLEIGTRIINLKDSSHLQSGITYDFDNITTVYVSIIFKYSMDE